MILALNSSVQAEWQTDIKWKFPGLPLFIPYGTISRHQMNVTPTTGGVIIDYGGSRGVGRGLCLILLAVPTNNGYSVIAYDWSNGW